MKIRGFSEISCCIDQSINKTTSLKFFAESTASVETRKSGNTRNLNRTGKELNLMGNKWESGNPMGTLKFHVGIECKQD